jgi:hypothetical protein
MRFEKTDYGWNLYTERTNGTFAYFGHFRTKQDAKRIYTDYKAAQVNY